MNRGCAIDVGVLALCTLHYCVGGRQSLHAALVDRAPTQPLTRTVSQPGVAIQIKEARRTLAYFSQTVRSIEKKSEEGSMTGGRQVQTATSRGGGVGVRRVEVKLSVVAIPVL
jgi:hypothetical protein